MVDPVEVAVPLGHVALVRFEMAVDEGEAGHPHCEADAHASLVAQLVPETSGYGVRLNVAEQWQEAGVHEDDVVNGSKRVRCHEDIVIAQSAS